MLARSRRTASASSLSAELEDPGIASAPLPTPSRWAPTGLRRRGRAAGAAGAESLFNLVNQPQQREFEVYDSKR